MRRPSQTGAATVVNSTTADSSQSPSAAALRAGEEVGAEVHAAGAHRHQRHQAGDAEQDQRRDVQRQRPAERVAAGAAQQPVAAQAARGGPGPQRRHDLELPAIGAFPQPRLRRLHLGGGGGAQETGWVGKGGHFRTSYKPDRVADVRR